MSSTAYYDDGEPPRHNSSFSLSMLLRAIFIFCLSMSTFLFCFHLGKTHQHQQLCGDGVAAADLLGLGGKFFHHIEQGSTVRHHCPPRNRASSHRNSSIATGHKRAKSGSCRRPTVEQHLSRMSLVLTKGLVKYKEDRLINIRYPPWSILMHSTDHSMDCDRIVHEYAAMKRKFSCLAVARSSIESSLNLLRHEEPVPSKEEEDEPATNSTGFFDNVANEKGRGLLQKKMEPLLENLAGLEEYVLSTLRRHNLRPGDNVVVMVVNAGEMDIFANFICSCVKYQIPLHQMVVFAGSDDIIPLIHAFGVIGIYHKDSFANVARRASYEYLDPIFIDMMWYKSFSVWLLLKMGFHVLFQDVDLVWFKDPFPYFAAKQLEYEQKFSYDIVSSPSQHQHQHLDNNPFSFFFQQHQVLEKEEVRMSSSAASPNISRHVVTPDGFFSDDGQRSLRYSPFYANSGFYYLRANNRMIYFTWSIMNAFALLHITGSHQNIFTVKLMEGLEFPIHMTMLPMNDFPSGAKYSHDRPFMRAIKDGHEYPYVFHM